MNGLGAAEEVDGAALIRPRLADTVDGGGE